MLLLFPRSIALSVVPTVICLSELCGKRIVFLYILLYMTTLTVKRHHQVTIGCAVFLDFLIELHLVYTIVPLIWHQSFFYVPLFGCSHFFVIMSVLWLMFKESMDLQGIFGSELPFDESIRLFGYCILPYLSTVICSWYLCTIFGLEYLPYYLLILSFTQYRVYITEPEIRNTKDAKYAAELHAVIVSLFFMAPLAAFVAKHTVIGGSPLAVFEYKLLLELFFIVSLCGLGVCFLGLRPLLSHYVPDATFLPMLPSALARDPCSLIRDASAIACSLLVTPAAAAHGIRLHFYTGPPVALTAVAAVILARGSGASSAAARLGAIACGLVGVGAFVAQVALFPWGVRYTLWDPSLMQRQFTSILIVTALAPIVLFLLARRGHHAVASAGNRLAFTGAFVAFLIAFYYCEWNFYLLGYASYHPVLVFSALVAAALAKIPDSKLHPSVKCCLAGLALTRCCLVLAHRLGGSDWSAASSSGDRHVFPLGQVACLCLCCLQAVCLLWSLPSAHWFYCAYVVDASGLRCGTAALATIASGTHLFVMLHWLRPGLVEFVSHGVFGRGLDYAEFVVLCLLFCGAAHSKSLRVPLERWTPVKILTVACLAGALALGLLRNDFLPFVTSNVRVTLATIQAALLCSVYAAACLYGRRIFAACQLVSIGCITLAVVLAFLHSLLYWTLFDQPLVSVQTVACLLGSAAVSAAFTLNMLMLQHGRGAAASTTGDLRLALGLFSCVILLGAGHLIALPGRASFWIVSYALIHQLLVCRRMLVQVRLNPDVVHLTHRLSDEERVYNCLLAATYSLLLLIGCWNPLDNFTSMVLPCLTLAWIGDRSGFAFLLCLLVTSQIAALYNVDFTGEDPGWWTRFVGFCEAAACAAQLPLHWILVSDSLAAAPANRWWWPCSILIGCCRRTNRGGVGGGGPSPREASESDQFNIFVALLVMPLPVAVLLLLSSSWQSACLAVATLLLGADYLANYRQFLRDLVQSSFAAIGDGR